MSRRSRRRHPHPVAAWDGVVFVHDGAFSGGVFKFRLLLPCYFPNRVVPVRARMNRVESPYIR